MKSKTLLLYLLVLCTLSLSAQSNRGLVVYYPMNGNANDNSGFGNNGYRGSGTSLTTDIAGAADNAYVYDGTSGATIDAFASASLNTANMTNVIMSAWIKPAINNTGFPEATIMTLITAATRTHYALTYSLQDNKITFRNFDGPNLTPAVNLVSNGTYARDVWHHVAIRIDSLNNFDLFINGVIDISTNATPVKPSGNTLTVGRNPIAPVSNNLSFLGTLDEIRVYDGYLTNTEIIEQYYRAHYCYGNASATSTSIAACYSYTVPSGHETYTVGGSYTDTLPNQFGCDSVITINLTINTADTAVTVSGDSLIANAAGASYVWLDCNNNYAPVANGNGQFYIPTANGRYAVAVTQNNCSDTSACITITGVGIKENGFGSGLAVYPNPTVSGNVIINLGDNYEVVDLEVSTVTGVIVKQKTALQTNAITVDIDGDPGLYFVTLDAGNGKKAVIKVLKQ